MQWWPKLAFPLAGLICLAAPAPSLAQGLLTDGALIQDFRVEPAKIKAGEKGQVSWLVQNSDQVNIDIINPSDGSTLKTGVVGMMGREFEST